MIIIAARIVLIAMHKDRENKALPKSAQGIDSGRDRVGLTTIANS